MVLNYLSPDNANSEKSVRTAISITSNSEWICQRQWPLNLEDEKKHFNEVKSQRTFKVFL